MVSDIAGKGLLEFADRPHPQHLNRRPRSAHGNRCRLRRISKRVSKHFSGRADQRSLTDKHTSFYIQCLPHFEHGGQRGCFRRWLFLVVRSKTTNVVRRWTRRRVQSLDAISERGEGPCDPHRDAADEWDQMWQHEALTSALPLLRQQVAGDLERERDYQVLHLRLIDGLSVAEVARMMNLNRDAVYTKYHDMRESLKSIVRAIAGVPDERNRL